MEGVLRKRVSYDDTKSVYKARNRNNRYDNIISIQEIYKQLK